MKNKFIKEIQSTPRINRKVSEIPPINQYGINLLETANANEIIDQIIEEPLRKACKELKAKGIETVMSSANRTNLLKEGEKALEKEDVRGRELFLDGPTYESAGKGYAWIMVNFDSLSDDNKKILFSLEETKNAKGENIGERIIWFVKSNPLMDILKKDSSEEKESVLDKEFEERSFSLKYNSDRYPKKVIFFRMPISDTTTIVDVEKYFERITKRLQQQQIGIDKPNMTRDK